MRYLFYRQDCCMGCRIPIAKFLALCVFFTFIIGCFIAISPITKDDCKCINEKYLINADTHKVLKNLKDGEDVPPSQHKLAVLVPYRDRFEELLIFAPHIHNFLLQQNVNHHIFVLNQVDHYRFNRASLINVGFHESHSDYDYIAMHDVDLLPLNPELPYKYPERGPFHVASPQLHPRYHYPTFVGGILLIKREDFLRVNGMSNKYWGWGLEDDEFYVRLKEAGLNVSRPVSISTGTNNTFRHIHDKNRRKRDMTKCYNQREVTRRRDRQTGLNSVGYLVESVQEVTIDSAPLTIINIHLKCNKQLTPWCECTESGSSNNGSIPDIKYNLKKKQDIIKF
ncbi:beta-1,4-galactosyltransferase 7 isoform X1 [Anabrus simplex]|uniref:beta-1,4-galactosyltransferase 7 isoform X1 n=1 Tax=Anabrus simplex TaxID=316456 RepID=UPI0035A3D1DC